MICTIGERKRSQEALEEAGKLLVESEVGWNCPHLRNRRRLVITRLVLHGCPVRMTAAPVAVRVLRVAVDVTQEYIEEGHTLVNQRSTEASYNEMQARSRLAQESKLRVAAA